MIADTCLPTLLYPNGYCQKICCRCWYLFPALLFCHQSKFKAFCKYARNFNSDDFDYDALENSDYIFMRWKVGTLSFIFSCEINLCMFSAWGQTLTSALVVHSGAVSSSRPHDQRYQWCLLCRFLLHLLPEVHSHY